MATFRCHVVLFALLLTTACYSLETGPLTTAAYPAAGAELAASELVVLLHGRGGDHTSFARHGWIETLHQARPGMDAVAPRLHFGYYRDRSLVQRVESEILAPALARGVPSPWLAGVSMGGMGALLIMREHPEQLAGVVLVAPFLGDAELAGEIAAAGGLLSWQPGTIAADDWQRALWAWLKEVAAAPARFPPLVLAYGAEDRFAASHRVLAAALPPDRVITRPGAHRDRVFAELWREVLGLAVWDRES